MNIFLTYMTLWAFEGRQFDWDDGNIDKNWQKHSVSPKECQEIFEHLPIIVLDDEKHSQKEQRFLAYGQTEKCRLLCVIYTLRNEKIRVISARDMSKKEKMGYAEIEKNTAL